MTVLWSQMAHWRYAFYVHLYKVCFVKLKTNNHANPPKVTQTGSSRRSEKAEIKLIWMALSVRRRWYGIRCACLPDKTPADKWTLVSFPLALPPPPHLDDTSYQKIRGGWRKLLTEFYEGVHGGRELKMAQKQCFLDPKCVGSDFIPTCPERGVSVQSASFFGTNQISQRGGRGLDNGDQWGGAFW